jgi:hypothetical protein
LSDGVAVSSVREVRGLVGTLAVKPPKPVRRTSRALSFIVSTRPFNLLHAARCAARFSISAVTGVRLRAFSASIVASTMSPH